VSVLGTVNDLKARAADLQRSRGKLLAAVDALQAACDHKWLDDGYDPRGSSTQYYKCSLCGAERRE
jgi:hypothetical protein